MKFFKILLLFLCLTLPLNCLAESLQNISSNKPIVQQIDNKNIKSYVYNVQKRIKNNWKNFKFDNTAEGETIIITEFTIAKDGSLLDCKIRKSSNNLMIDEMTLDAIRKTAPFEPIPSDFTGKSITLQMIFVTLKH